MHLLATTGADYAVIGQGGPWQGHSVPEGGLEPDFVLVLLEGLSQRLHQAQGWGTWFGVVGGEVVVSIAVKDPVLAGAVEIGYGTAPARRGRGHATAAVVALLPLLAERGITLVRAESATGNIASGRVLQKAGFVDVGTRVDPEDGDLQLWARRLD